MTSYYDHDCTESENPRRARCDWSDCQAETVDVRFRIPVPITPEDENWPDGWVRHGELHYCPEHSARRFEDVVRRRREIAT